MWVLRDLKPQTPIPSVIIIIQGLLNNCTKLYKIKLLYKVKLFYFINAYSNINVFANNNNIQIKVNIHNNSNNIQIAQIIQIISAELRYPGIQVFRLSTDLGAPRSPCVWPCRLARDNTSGNTPRDNLCGCSETSNLKPPIPSIIISIQGL